MKNLNLEAKWIMIGTAFIILAVLVAAQISSDTKLAIKCIEAGMEFVNGNCVSP